MALMETLRDDFTVLDATKWPSRYPGASSVVSGRMQVVDSTGAYPYVSSANIYDIRNSYALAQVTVAPLSGLNSQQTYFAYYASSGNGVGLAFGGGTLQKVVWTGGTETDTFIANYDATAMAWWRIRHDGTNIRLGYSADGAAWTETAGFDPGFAYTSTGWASLVVGRWGSGDTATGYFDRFNLAPTGGGVTAPLVPPSPSTGVAPVPAKHMLGIGPWNSSVVWRGAVNHGVSAGQRASVPVLSLPLADSLSVTLRLGEAAEARSSHYFPREDSVVIQEMATDLWWRRRDPRRGVTDGIGRFNATTVELSIDDSGAGVDTSVTWTDYQGWLEDRLVLKYLTPGAVPPTTMWNTGTLVTDILRWAVPTNMGLDLTGIQAATPDITTTIKSPFHIPLGTPIKSVMENLITVSTSPWEWWVEMPDSDANRPRLRLAAARGTDRGVTLIDIGGHGPIERWSVQAAGDKYANALYFMGQTGDGVVFQYDDQIALLGQRDASDNDDTVKATKDGGGVPYMLNSAAQVRLAKLAAPQPSYQLVLRSGFYEGRSHIDVGDWVSVTLRLGQELITGKFRVSELLIEIDGNGFERVTLTLGVKRPAKDPRSRASSTARLVRYLKKYVDPTSG